MQLSPKLHGMRIWGVWLASFWLTGGQTAKTIMKRGRKKYILGPLMSSVPSAIQQNLGVSHRFGVFALLPWWFVGFGVFLVSLFFGGWWLLLFWFAFFGGGGFWGFFVLFVLGFFCFLGFFSNCSTLISVACWCGCVLCSFSDLPHFQTRRKVRGLC